MLDQKQIKDIIIDIEVGDCLAWVIDIDNDYHNDPDLVREGYVYFIGPYENNIQKMAHKISCKGFYSCKSKMKKAMRRLLKQINSDDLEKIYNHVKSVLNDDHYDINPSIIKITSLEK